MLHPPWPGPDRDAQASTWIWDSYTDEQLLAGVTAVYGAALEWYQWIVDAWFPKVAPRMETAVILPARFVGIVVPAPRNEEHWGGPRMSWYWDPLPHGSHSSIDIRLGKELLDFTNYYDEVTERLRRLRPAAATWISSRFHYPFIGRNLHTTPATELVYNWLWDDLRRVGWVDGLLGDPR